MFTAKRVGDPRGGGGEITSIIKLLCVTGLTVFLSACFNGSEGITVENEPTGMKAGMSEVVDLDYTRIRFDKGAISAKVRGKLSGFDDENEFVIDVAEGQVMSVKKATDDDELISVAIISPLGENVTDMDAGCNGNKTVDIKMSGDYTIHVTQCMKADPWDNDYTLDVWVK